MALKKTNVGNAFADEISAAFQPVAMPERDRQMSTLMAQGAPKSAVQRVANPPSEVMELGANNFSYNFTNATSGRGVGAGMAKDIMAAAGPLPGQTARVQPAPAQQQAIPQDAGQTQNRQNMTAEEAKGEVSAFQLEQQRANELLKAGATRSQVQSSLGSQFSDRTIQHMEKLASLRDDKFYVDGGVYKAKAESRRDKIDAEFTNRVTAVNTTIERRIDALQKDRAQDLALAADATERTRIERDYDKAELQEATKLAQNATSLVLGQMQDKTKQLEITAIDKGLQAIADAEAKNGNLASALEVTNERVDAVVAATALERQGLGEYAKDLSIPAVGKVLAVLSGTLPNDAELETNAFGKDHPFTALFMQSGFFTSLLGGNPLGSPEAKSLAASPGFEDRLNARYLRFLESPDMIKQLRDYSLKLQGQNAQLQVPDNSEIQPSSRGKRSTGVIRQLNRPRVKREEVASVEAESEDDSIFANVTLPAVKL